MRHREACGRRSSECPVDTLLGEGAPVDVDAAVNAAGRLAAVLQADIARGPRNLNEGEGCRLFEPGSTHARPLGPTDFTSPSMSLRIIRSPRPKAGPASHFPIISSPLPATAGAARTRREAFLKHPLEGVFVRSARQSQSAPTRIRDRRISMRFPTWLRFAQLLERYSQGAFPIGFYYSPPPVPAPPCSRQRAVA